MRNAFALFGGDNTANSSTDTSSELQEISLNQETQGSNEDEILIDNVSWHAPCLEADSTGRIQGPSKSILICHEFEEEKYWTVKPDSNGLQTGLLPGDSCHVSDDHDDYAAFDDIKGFAARLVCVAGGTLQPYPEFVESDYELLDERELALVIKNSQDHVSRKLVVYGYISNIGVTYGPNGFSGYVSNRNREWNFEYGDEQVSFYAEDDLTNKLLQNDRFKAWVRVRPPAQGTLKLTGVAVKTPALRIDRIEFTGAFNN